MGRLGWTAALVICFACSRNISPQTLADRGDRSASTNTGPDHERALRIMTAFSQGAAGNCASIAAIKLALFAYGYDGTFKRVGNASTAYTLRNGREVRVTDDEVEQVRKLADFRPKPGEPGWDAPLVDQAVRMLAVMAKNKCEHDGRGEEIQCTSVSNAFDRVDHFLAEDAGTNLDLLGLTDEVHPPPSDIRRFASFGAYIVTNEKHAAFGYGDLYDEEQSPRKPQYVSRFEHYHSTIFTRAFGDRRINAVLTVPQN